MKKSLVALAALAATSAFAQTVTITGNVDVAWSNKSAYGGDGKLFLKAGGIGDGTNTPNRIIFTVKEDLGGGLGFTFLNEHAISPTNPQDWGIRTASAAPLVVGTRATNTADNQIPGDGSAATTTNRQTYVALNKGGMGEVRAGYLVASIYNASAQSGYFFGQEQYGALLKDFGMVEVGNNRGNGFQYISPKFGMFTAGVQKLQGTDHNYTAEGSNQPFTENKIDRTAYRLDVDAGAVRASYVRTDYTALRTGANGNNVTSIFGVTGSAGTNTDVKGTHDHLSAIYTTGPVEVSYQYNKLDLTNNTTATSSRNGSASQYGVRYTMGATSVYAITGSAEMNQTSNGAKLNDIKNTQYGIRHALSKRTTAYVATGTSKDSIVTAADRIEKGTYTALGLTHAF